MLNFERSFFDELVDKTLFYSPKIEIKPVHLANGLFRAVCGKYANSERLHRSICATGRSASGAGGDAQKIVHALFTADGAVFSKANFSSYTLSHISHITSDNHDRRTGEWLAAILTHDEGEGASPALELLRSLLTEDNQHLSDELSILTLPLAGQEAIELKNFRSRLSAQAPTSLKVNDAGAFCDPLLYSIRRGFDQLAAHAGVTRKRKGKLETLRHLVIWGCFSVYLHLANSGHVRGNQRLPMVLCLSRNPSPTLREASTQSYQWVNRSIDKFFRGIISSAVDQIAATEQDGSWETSAAVRRRIESMIWKSSGGRMQQETEHTLAFTPLCLRFFDGYLCDTTNQSPRFAFANALTDMLGHVLSSSPTDVARALGVRIGLLTASRQHTKKLYAPGPELLEVLIRASIPPGTHCTITELADYWASQYGLLIGVLGTENSTLAEWGINPIDGGSLRTNVDALVDILEMSGYAHQFSDGVTFITAE